MSTGATYRMGAIMTSVLVVELLVWAAMLSGWWILDTEVPAFRFERPEMLRAMLLGPLVVVIFLLHLLWRQRSLRKFASDGTLRKVLPAVSPLRTVLRFLLFRHGLGLVVIALATPQYGTRQEEVKADGIDLVVALDVSNSMVCEDLKPNRIGSARLAMERLIDRMRGDRLGIVVFAGEAFVQLPITTDRSAAKLFLSTIGTNSVSTQGTAIGTAIELASRSFDPESSAGKAIIVITDGENHEDDAEGAARSAHEKGIIVHTIGMGTPQGGPIPVRRNGQLTGFRKDRSGSTVVSRLDENMLQRIADAGGGSYIRATERSTGIEELAEELRTMDRVETGTYRFTAHADQFQYPLGLGMILLLLGMSFGERASSLPQLSRVFGAGNAATMSVALLLSGCGDAAKRKADNALRAGNEHYRSELFALADSTYATAPDDHRTVYNRGNAEYRLGLWNDAVERFNEAATMADGTSEQSTVYHNLGNARLMQAHWADSMGHVYLNDIGAIRSDGSDIRGKIKLAMLRDSLRTGQRRMELLVDSALHEGALAYKKALRMEPGAEDSRHNLTAAMAMIESRKKQDKDGKDGQDEEKELSARAKELLAQADRLVDEHRFVEALGLLLKGLEQEPTLEQRKDYMEKLQVVRKAVEAK